MKLKGGLPLILILITLLLIIPFLVSSYYVGLMTQILIFALFAESLDILVGHVGLPSLGHAAFFGVPAYVAALVSLHLSNNFWLCLLAGLCATCIIGAFFGLLVMRARGAYFLMITLALAQLLWGLAFKWTSVTGGYDGISGISRPLLGIPWSINGTLSYYFFVLLLVTVASWALWVIVKSPFGYALKGIRESETRMLCLGYNVWAYKYMAFLLAAAFAGLSGVLFVFYNAFVCTDDMGIILSAKGLLMVILGGAGTLVGPILGAGIIVFLENIICTFTERWSLVLGIIYVVVILFFPNGILGGFQKR